MPDFETPDPDQWLDVLLRGIESLPYGGMIFFLLCAGVFIKVVIVPLIQAIKGRGR